MDEDAKTFDGGDGLKSLKLRSGYSTGRFDLIADFYVPCLSVATAYDRAVGYFRSSLFVLVGLAFSDFALRGGKTRLVCSPYLDQRDIDAIGRGVAVRETVGAAVLNDLRNILQTPHNRPAVELLATLVGCEALEIRLAFRPSASGIFHDKVGIFRDKCGNRISFLGSANETFSAWAIDANHEGFEVFKSWTSDTDQERVVRHSDYFEALWLGEEQGVRTVPFEGVSREELLSLRNPEGIDAAAARVRQMVGAARSSVSSDASEDGKRLSLLQHQESVVNNWFTSGCRGLIDHATGAGKTLAALEITRRWISTGRPALIFVPTEILFNQWYDNAAQYLYGATTFLLAGAGHGRDTWIRHLPDFTRDMPELGPRVTIATMQTGSTSEFITKVQQGEHLLIVADEVHRAGSSSFRRLLDLEAGGRLGLSATPERFGDPVGTAEIFRYFGDILPPPFGLKEAIAAQRLVPYDYYIHLVALSPEEQELWDETTERIGREFARLPEDALGRKLHSTGFRLLLIQRAAILKRAVAKIELARRLLAELFEEGDRWLIYCDTQEQLRGVIDSLKSAGLDALEYHSAMLAAKPETLREFERRGGILVAIRCLDEGVDIPAVNRALILASSSNPREFIQRRGRALRRAPNKYSAAIHDAIVTPCGDIDATARACFSSELRRALQFAENARNASVRQRLRLLLAQERSSPSDPIESYEEDS